MEKNKILFADDDPEIREALRLLLGERVMDEPAVVFQANFRQGGGVFAEYKDQQLGSTFFCYSIRPELYAGPEEQPA